MSSITETEFARIVDGLIEDADAIFRHNPVGTRRETLLWMLMSVLISYLSIAEIETPCFTGSPDADTYRNAVKFILAGRRTDDFDPEPYLTRLENA